MSKRRVQRRDNDIWSLFWSSTRSPNDAEREPEQEDEPIPAPPPPLVRGESAQTLVLVQPNRASDAEREKQRVARTMRLAGFDRAEYSLMPTIDMERVVSSSSNEEHSHVLECPTECEILQQIMSNTALLALQRGRESPYDVDTLQAVGEYLTHVAAWRHAVRYRLSHLVVISGSKFVSRSDNAAQRIEKLMREAPESYDVLVLGAQKALVTDSVGAKEKVPGAPSVVRYGSSSPMFQDISAYVVSLQGARKLLERALPIETRIAPYICMTAQIDCSMLALVAQPAVADVTTTRGGWGGTIAAGKGGGERKSNIGLLALEDISMQVPRRFLAFTVAGIALLCVILLVTTIVFAIKWRQATTSKAVKTNFKVMRKRFIGKNK